MSEEQMVRKERKQMQVAGGAEVRRRHHVDEDQLCQILREGAFDFLDHLLGGQREVRIRRPSFRQQRRLRYLPSRNLKKTFDLLYTKKNFFCNLVRMKEY